MSISPKAIHAMRISEGGVPRAVVASALVIVLGFVAALSTTLVASRLAFRQEAANITADIAREVHMLDLAARTTAGFVDASEWVTPAEFSSFAAAICDGSALDLRIAMRPKREIDAMGVDPDLLAALRAGERAAVVDVIKHDGRASELVALARVADPRRPDRNEFVSVVIATEDFLPRLLNDHNTRTIRFRRPAAGFAPPDAGQTSTMLASHLWRSRVGQGRKNVAVEAEAPVAYFGTPGLLGGLVLLSSTLLAGLMLSLACRARSGETALREENGRVWAQVRRYTDEMATRTRELARFQRILDAARDCVFIFDAETLRYTYVNQGAADQIRVRREDLLGRTPTDIMPFITEDMLRVLLEDLVRGEREWTTYETIHRTSKGEDVPVEILFQHVAEAGGEGHFVAIVRDVAERQNLERELRDLAWRLEIAAEAASIGIWELDLERNALTWNRPMREFYGFDPAECENPVEAWQSAIHPDDAPRVRETFDNALRVGGDFQNTFRIRNTATGEERYIDARATIERSYDGKARRVIGVNIDNTERQLAAEITSRHQAELQRILDALPALVFYKDDKNNILRLNKAAADSIGKPIEEIEGRSTDEFFPPDHAAGYLADDLEVIRSGKPRLGITEPYEFRPGERRVIRTDKIPLCDEQGRVTALVAVCSDITEQLDTQARLEMALSAANLGLWDWNIDNGEIFLNENYFGMLGFTGRNRSIGSYEQWRDLIHPDDLPGAVATLERHFRNPAEAYHVEFRMRTSTGRWMWVLSIGKVIERSEEAKPRRMLGVHIDIDEQKRTQKALAQAHDAAEEANRAKSAFLANMSHEIRTPMTAILGYADVLSEEARQHRQLREHIETIRRNGEHLLAIINDVLDISKIEAGQMRVERIETNLPQILQQVASLLRVRSIGKSIDFRLDYVTPVPATVRTDPVRLRQILMNLIGNAIKFTEIGSVTVRIGVEHLGKGTPDAQPRLCIAVVDTGVGMSEEQIGRLFNAFSQADDSVTRRYGGSGMGLHISKRLAAMIGGDITVASRLDLGSTFELTIPITEQDLEHVVQPGEGGVMDDQPEHEAPKPKPALPPLDGVRVLLAEDGIDNQRLIGHLLRKAGATVEVANHGADALEAFERARDEHAEPHVILMDMQMPEMDGYAATNALRLAGRLGPIIALTAHAMAGDRERCLAAGCDDYLTKPVDRRTLVETVARYSPANAARDAA
ncbi:MAG: PAS domain S-box protein [Phycisphaerales bacterium]|nr:MAG: PAS domain S-box protein [Phycisphaerales bacterium]